MASEHRPIVCALASSCLWDCKYPLSSPSCLISFQTDQFLCPHSRKDPRPRGGYTHGDVQISFPEYGWLHRGNDLRLGHTRHAILPREHGSL